MVGQRQGEMDEWDVPWLCWPSGCMTAAANVHIQVG